MAKGADVNLGDEDGETPLYVAAFENKAETVEALLTAGALYKPSPVKTHSLKPPGFNP
jgi:ankyrin repeat protein